MAIEFRRRYAGIFTTPMPTDKCSVAAGTGLFVAMGAKIKCRVETVTGFNRHPVRSMPAAVTNTRCGRQEFDFMVVPSDAFFRLTRRLGCVPEIPPDRRQRCRRVSVP